MNEMQVKIKGELDKHLAGEIQRGFELQCLFTLVDGYRSMKNSGDYNLSWEEELLTAKLINHMNHSRYSSKWKLDIKPEYPVYTNDVYNGLKKPKKAPVIDIRIMNWSQETKSEYFIEAKNLAQNDWIKTDGSEVRASGLRGRYIDTGIDHFMSGYYPRGSLAGYVLEGNADGIAKGINRLLENNRRNRHKEILRVAKPINNHAACYQSDHNQKNGIHISLNHIFLSFSNT